MHGHLNVKLILHNIVQYRTLSDITKKLTFSSDVRFNSRVYFDILFTQNDWYNNILIFGSFYVQGFV